MHVVTIPEHTGLVKVEERIKKPDEIRHLIIMLTGAKPFQAGPPFPF